MQPRDKFLGVSNLDELAELVGLSYEDLASLVYRPQSLNYTEFQIPKKTGGYRLIKSPCKRLKAIQRRLSECFYETYWGRPSAHGFIRSRSIVTNARAHVGKRFVFNIDLEDFFGAIHFGRVRNLFESPPFSFGHAVATVLAQTCCVDEGLPQGAPTSPILSNMIAFKLDGQLERLAKDNHATYSRYADDITFSFTCSRHRLPGDVVSIEGDSARPGAALARVVRENGFAVNYGKVRLAGRSSRMDVTGLTVNEFPNVRRRYLKQISAMLHAWEAHGYDSADAEFNEKYSHRHRASGLPKSFEQVVRGKLAFLRSVRGGEDLVFNRLARRYNSLVGSEGFSFRLFVPPIDPEDVAVGALWVIEVCYDDCERGTITSQGTGFLLAGAGLLTCAHVVSAGGRPYASIEAFTWKNPVRKYVVEVLRLDSDRDLAVCSLELPRGECLPAGIMVSTEEIAHGLPVKLLGFPDYAVGHSYYAGDAKVAARYASHGIQKFEVDGPIRMGNSGGPVIDAAGRLLGVVVEGATGSTGRNAALAYSEVEAFLHRPDPNGTASV